ncbi:hypothetical protein ACFVVC_10935 [Pseudarthrobacter sp. NPDC058196]|uniref:hypothetical protein n=1 Tax=Pseudarthrobacter sp. NPDC058196 TaxID=3346376 RepID=UPI0036DD3D1B
MGELFTDRESEARAFSYALRSFRSYLDSDTDADDARLNVLVYYGLGGIGKTALSERLEKWANRALPLVNGWGPPPATQVNATARIDLHGSAGQIDIATALITLRAGVSKLAHRWPVFDLALAAYLSALRPGEPLPKFGGRDELTDVVTGTLRDTLSDIGQVFEVAAAGTGAGLGVYAVRKLMAEVQRSRDLRLGIDAYPGFEKFLTRCSTEPSPTEPRPDLACEIAELLSWELSKLAPCPLVAVFVDTTERLAIDPRRVSEGYLNSLIYAMPNVLFVLTGRDMLDWYNEARVNLPNRGRRFWPNLVPGTDCEPRQHLLGRLSPSDTRAVILRGREQLDLPMSDGVVEELVRSSAGLPQYLELARQVAITIKGAGDGRQVEVADVSGSLGELVMRVLEDVPPDEQRAIRGASLFRIFDTHLISAAAGVDHGCAERAVGRPMIDRYNGERFPHRMHDAVREAIRSADHRVAAGWSEQDWKVAASRAVAAVRELHDDAKKRQDSREVLDALGIAITLVCEQEVTLDPSGSPSYADWLSKAIVFSPSVQGLGFRVPGASTTTYGQRVLDFIGGKAIDRPMEERMQLLQSVFESDHPLRCVAGRHLGYNLKAQYRWDEALTVFDRLVAIEPSPLNVAQAPLVLSMARRFADAMTAAEGTNAMPQIVRTTEYAHGRPERYFREIDEKIAKLQNAGRQRELLEDLGDKLVRRALFVHDLDTQELQRYADEAELVGHSYAMRSAMLATVLHNEGDRAFILAVLERLRVLDQTAAAKETIGFRYALGELCDALLQGDRDRLVRLQEEAALVKLRSRAWIPVEMFLEAIDLPLPRVETQWLEEFDVVKQRWAGHLNAYLAKHMTV